jgi:hypothetical protein
VRLTLAAALLLGCSRAATPAIETEGDAVALKMSPQDCCDYVITHASQTMLTKYLSCCVALLATACPPIGPEPVPPQPPAATGGATSTGGNTSTGGRTATGGAVATGGMVATGGTYATGGTTSAPSTDPFGLACANLKAQGCPEGAIDNCAANMAYRCTQPKVRCNPACIINATSKATLQGKCKVACGSL